MIHICKSTQGGNNFMITKEIWLPLNTNIDRFSSLRKDYYMISNYGRIGTANGNILTINNTTRPPSVSLMKTGSYATQRIGVNILVALHFIMMKLLVELVAMTNMTGILMVMVIILLLH